jgi:hypothetical protein
VRHFGKPRFTQSSLLLLLLKKLLNRTFPSQLLSLTRSYFGTFLARRHRSLIKRRRTLAETLPSTSTFFHQGVPSQHHDRDNLQRQWRATQQASRAGHQTRRQTTLTPTHTFERARRLESLPRFE